MKVSGFLPVSSRRAMIAVGVATLFFATSGASVQPVVGLTQEAAKPADVDPLKFDYDGPMILLYQIKKERVKDFEDLWTGIRAGLAKSPKPDVKAFGETLQPMKVQGAELYVFRLDPPSKTFTYNPTKLLYDNVNYEKPAEGLFTRAEADELFKKFDGSFVPNGIQPWKLEKVGGGSLGALALPGAR